MSDILLQLWRARVGEGIVKASVREGGEWHGPCPSPSCGGTDRFFVRPEQVGGKLCAQHGITGRWFCRQCSPRGGDALSFLTDLLKVPFKEACAELGIPLEGGEARRRRYRPLSAGLKAATDFRPTAYAAPADAWIQHATKLATEAHARLLETPNVLRWLDGRGIPEDAVRAYRLGYIEAEGKCPDGIFRAREAFGLPPKTNQAGRPVRSFKIPRGVTIPVWRGDECLRIRIRRRNADLGRDDPKYLLIPQPSPAYSAPMVLPPRNVPADMATWVIVEAELDAMCIHHACCGRVGVMSVLTVKGKPHDKAHEMLARAARILVALDVDGDRPDGSNPGADAWPWWRDTYRQARVWPVPEGKDPGEAFAKGVDLAEWIYAGMPGTADPAPAPAAAPDADGDPADLPDALRDDAPREAVAPADPEPVVPPTIWQDPDGEPSAHADAWRGGAKRLPAPAGMPFGRITLPKGVTHASLLLEMFDRDASYAACALSCPLTKWNPVYVSRHCPQCPGHPQCLLAVVRSPEFRDALAAARRDGYDALCERL